MRDAATSASKTPERLGALLAEKDALNEWERWFFTKLLNKFQRGRQLSWRESRLMNAVFDRVFPGRRTAKEEVVLKRHSDILECEVDAVMERLPPGPYRRDVIRLIMEHLANSDREIALKLRQDGFYARKTSTGDVERRVANVRALVNAAL